MGDPSERHGELLECGCEFAQGTWFYCAEHQPRPPLDLRAVEARHKETMNGFSSSVGTYADSAADVPALLTYCRALRAALEEITTDYDDYIASGGPHARELLKRAAAVLAQAQDEEPE